jgi:hypothetical protein
MKEKCKFVLWFCTYKVNMMRTLWLIFFAIVLFVIPAAVKVNEGILIKEWQALKALSFGDVLGVLGIMIATITMAILFMRHMPLGKVSWLAYIARLGNRNSSYSGTNITIAPACVPFIWPMFLGCLVLCVPGFSKYEENMFRYGDYGLSMGAIFALLFGLTHWLAGIPFGAALALSIPGFWFMVQSRIGGIELSTAHHSVYNIVLMGMLAFVLCVRDITFLCQAKKEFAEYYRIGFSVQGQKNERSRLLDMG